VPVPGACDVPRTGPADAIGCYLAGIEQLGAAPATPLFWHLDAYPTRAAAEAARREHGMVAEAHGRVWLFTIAEAQWRPAGGERVARVGPLPSPQAAFTRRTTSREWCRRRRARLRTVMQGRKRGTSSRAPTVWRRPTESELPARARA
ncbi:MAG: hypothetical protein ABI969_15955, partial [bacterium]